MNKHHSVFARFTPRAAALAATAMLGACGAPVADPGDPSAALADSTAIRDVRATGCEIFLDKAAAIDHHDQRMTEQAVQLFVKLRPEALDGAVKSVSFFAMSDSSGYYRDHSDFRAYPLAAFAGSRDYFTGTFGVYGADNDVGSSTTVWQGAFYVETENGTRYWANPADGGNFWLDRNLWNTLGYHHDPGPVAWAPISLPVDRVSKTADSPGAGSYLNPASCR